MQNEGINQNDGQNVAISRTIDGVADLTRGKNVLTLTDDNVYKLYPALFGENTFVIPHGEDSKTLTTAERVLEAMAAAGLDRKGLLVAVGGGVVGDLGGFAAAIYMRGIRWRNVPTTLLAQVDSSIGGKTGVDLKNFKNMAGAFHLPDAVVIRTDFLKTLDARETLCGLGEAYKSALLDAACMRAWQAYGKGENDFFSLVRACARFKESVVREDFTESGRRKILNLGHTAGHALEYLDEHRRSHGEYVLMGLLCESGAAVKSAHANASTYAEIERQCLALLGDEAVSFLKNTDMRALARAARADKKNADGKISVILAENFQARELFYGEAQFAEALQAWKSDL